MSETIYPHIIYVPSAGQEQVFIPQSVTPPEPPDPEPSTEPKVTIAFPDADEMLLASGGIELEPYIDPFGEFTQQCFVCTSGAVPGFRAIYRPDLNSTREEWIFEYGDPWIPPPAANLPAYTVNITLKDGTLVTLSTVGHYWFSRWRWQSSPRPVRRTHNQLAEQNLIPYMDTTGLATGPILTVSDYTPMAYCGIPKEQGQTGGYPGLGIQTGWQTQYLVRGAPEASFRNQAEASGTFQAHVRDTNTWAPIDLKDEYPSATMYSSSTGSPYILRGPVENRTDTGHMPSITYVPFLLTGDPYYLEANQFWANQNMLSQPGNSSRISPVGRYFAWPMRHVYECFLATPDNVPSWLLPKSYWKHWVDMCRGLINDRMNDNSDPYYYIFHTIPDYGQSNTADPSRSGDHVWQQNMLELVVSWIATTQDDWINQAEWLIQNGIARASSTSGWCRARPSPYHMRLQNASALAEAMTVDSTSIKLQYVQRFKSNMTIKIDSETMILNNSTDGLTWSLKPRSAPKTHNINASVYGDKVLSWCEAKDLNILTYNWTDTADNDHLSPETTDLTYMTYQRCALAQALHAGLQTPGLQEAYNWIDSEIRRFVSTKHSAVGDNWCVMPNVPSRARRIHRKSFITDEMLDLINEHRGNESPEE